MSSKARRGPGIPPVTHNQFSPKPAAIEDFGFELVAGTDLGEMPADNSERGKEIRRDFLEMLKEGLGDS